jgi:lycopene cyclase domain-containing protein
MNIYIPVFLFSFMYLYLQLLFIFVIIPNVLLLYVNRKMIHLKTLSISLLMLFLIALFWDQLSVLQGLWTFSENEMIGFVFGLPIEEYLFFFFVPLLCINVYLCMERIFIWNEKR